MVSHKDRSRKLLTGRGIILNAQHPLTLEERRQLFLLLAKLEYRPTFTAEANAIIIGLNYTVNPHVVARRIQLLLAEHNIPTTIHLVKN